jgi:pentachlorophenol monooxygenase/3-(3-hydroxy-phenyl)propionate hydroxylase
VPPAGPGILVPDAPVLVRGDEGSGTRIHARRFRQLAREGLLLLVAPGADAAAAKAATQGAEAPVRVLELAAIDQTGALGAALDARPGDVWMVRPDAHVAAVLEHPTSAIIQTALHRALATTDREEDDHGVLPTVR